MIIKISIHYLLYYTIEKIESENYRNKKSFKEFFKGYRFLFSTFSGWRYKISIFQYIFFASYVANTKKILCLPLAFIVLVPFQTVIRWIKERRDSKPMYPKDDL